MFFTCTVFICAQIKLTPKFTDDQPVAVLGTTLQLLMFSMLCTQ